jgi:hypothetical protein
MRRLRGIIMSSTPPARPSLNPDEIASLFNWRHNAWYSVDGTVDALEFEHLASAKAASGGPRFDRRRWFCEDDELLQANGKTYAFSKMWGEKTWHKAMNILKENILNSKLNFRLPLDCPLKQHKREGMSKRSVVPVQR